MLLIAILAAVVALVITGHTVAAVAIGIVGGAIVLLSLLVAGAAVKAVGRTHRSINSTNRRNLNRRGRI